VLMVLNEYEDSTRSPAMKYDPNKHHRRSIRLKGYDYSQPGAYFVTICIRGNLPLLAEIRDRRIYPSLPGQMVRSIWEELPRHYPGVELDAFVLMPDHIHGIIWLTGDRAPRRGNSPVVAPFRGVDPISKLNGSYPAHGNSVGTENRAENGVGTGALPLQVRKGMALGDVVHRFKSLTTAKYRQGVNQLGWLPFDKKFWQRNYYERIIRTDESLELIREYILNNPLDWERDREHRKLHHPIPDV